MNKENKNSKMAACTLAFFSFICLAFSLITYTQNNHDRIVMNNKVEKLVEKTVTKSTSENKKEEKPEGNVSDDISINWEYLKSVNNDIIGWISIPNSNVNYPLLHGDDNLYYERRMFDKSQNIFGSIYTDFRNTGVGEDENTIIYGHNTLNESMFAHVSRYINQEFMNNHPYIYIYTPDATYKAKVFQAFTIDNPSDIYQISVDSITEYIKDIQNREDKLEYSFIPEEITEGDKIITLSTCSYIRTQLNPTERVIVQAKLV